MYSGFIERSNFAYPVRFFSESVAGGRVKQSPWTLQQEPHRWLFPRGVLKYLTLTPCHSKIYICWRLQNS